MGLFYFRRGVGVPGRIILGVADTTRFVVHIDQFFSGACKLPFVFFIHGFDA